MKRSGHKRNNITENRYLSKNFEKATVISINFVVIDLLKAHDWLRWWRHVRKLLRPDVCKCVSPAGRLTWYLFA